MATAKMVCRITQKRYLEETDRSMHATICQNSMRGVVGVEFSFLMPNS